jgi:hypothetical protein
MTGIKKLVVAEGIRLSVCNLIHHKGINSTNKMILQISGWVS